MQVFGKTLMIFSLLLDLSVFRKYSMLKYCHMATGHHSVEQTPYCYF